MKNVNWKEITINQEAFEIYHKDQIKKDEPTLSYNYFADSEVGKKYILEVRREKKLKRILK